MVILDSRFSILDARAAALALTALVVAWAGSACAQEGAAPKRYRCPLLANAPEVDGDVAGDPVWRDVEVAGGYRNLDTDLPSAKQTRFRLGYTAEALYVAVTCDEPKPDLVLAFMADGEQLWNEDSVEVFLSPDRETELQFAVNAIGSRASPRTLRKWEAVTQTGQSWWSVEIKLPWEVVGAFPAEGATWGLNVCRNILTAGVKEHSTWAQVEDGFHEPEHFGDLTFEPIAPELRPEVEALVEQVAMGQFALLFARPRKGVFLLTDSGEERVVFNQGPYVAPRLSPDGKWILYNATEIPVGGEEDGSENSEDRSQNSELGGRMGVWIVERSGEGKRRVCDGGQAVWSPDGARILLEREGRLIERKLDSGEERVISPEGAPLTWPSYGPDGGIMCTDATGEYIYNLDGAGELTELVRGDIGSGPRCSPDGRRVAYQDGAHIHVMDLETNETRPLTLEPGIQAWPLWSRDGTFLCYAAAPSPFTETVPYGRGWDVHFVALDKPGEVNRAQANVFPAFGWNGASLEPLGTNNVRGATLSLWRGKRPLRLKSGQGVASEKGWKPVPLGTPPGAVEQRIAIENDWLVLEASPKSVLLIVKDEALVKKPIVLDVGNPTVRSAFETDALRVTQASADVVAIEVEGALGGQRVSVSYAVSRTRPGAVVTVGAPGTQVTVKADVAVAVVPDLFANDLVVDPGSGARGAVMALPKTPLLLGGLAGTNAMVAAIPLSDEASFALVNGSEGEALAGIVAAPGRDGVFVGVLAGSKLWEPAEATQDADSGAWQAEWRKPFNAVWRLAARGGDEAWSRTWSMDDLSNLGWDPLPIDAAFSGPPERALAYIWARDPSTSVEIWTPQALLLSVLGPRACDRALDVKGMQGYRTADVPLPFPQLSTRGIGWQPFMGHMEREGFGILEIMAGTIAAGTPGVRSFVTHMTRDAIRLVGALDVRIEEYEQHLAAIRAFCAASGSTSAGGFAAEIDAALAFGQDAQRTDMVHAEEALAPLLDVVGTKSGGMVCGKPEFKAFSRQCRELLAERQSILNVYRGVVKRVRDGAARQMLADGPFKPVGDELREMCHAALRLRYYLEGDWRGETPQPAGGDE